ncbi:hypothetical protein KQX54_011240, partial [Cotesia glomerata]
SIPPSPCGPRVHPEKDEGCSSDFECVIDWLELQVHLEKPWMSRRSGFIESWLDGRKTLKDLAAPHPP